MCLLRQTLKHDHNFESDGVILCCAILIPTRKTYDILTEPLLFQHAVYAILLVLKWP